MVGGNRRDATSCFRFAQLRWQFNLHNPLAGPEQKGVVGWRIVPIVPWANAQLGCSWTLTPTPGFRGCEAVEKLWPFWTSSHPRPALAPPTTCHRDAIWNVEVALIEFEGRLRSLLPGGPKSLATGLARKRTGPHYGTINGILPNHPRAPLSLLPPTFLDCSQSSTSPSP